MSAICRKQLDCDRTRVSIKIIDHVKASTFYLHVTNKQVVCEILIVNKCRQQGDNCNTNFSYINC